MAKGNANVAAEKLPEELTNDDFDKLWADFDRQSRSLERLDTPDIDGLYKKPQVGDKYGGTLVSSWTYESQYGETTILVLKLAVPCRAYTREDQEVTLKPGQFMGIVLTAGVRELSYYVEKQALVKVVCVGKTKTKRGSMWRYEVSGEKSKRSERPINAPRVSPDGAEDR